MDALIIRKQSDKLRKRRDQLALALQRLGRDQDQVDQNTDWLDQAAFESRVDLVDHLSDRYLTEIGQIDKALDRIQTNQYGVCLACHNAIELHRLETAPETEYCSSCQDMREEVQRV